MPSQPLSVGCSFLCIQRSVSDEHMPMSAAQNMQTVDLSKSFSNSDDDLFGTIVKPQNDSDPDLSVPTLNEGLMFSDGSSIFLYGGEMSTLPGKNPIPSLATWKYDIQQQSWTSISFNGVPDARLTGGPDSPVLNGPGVLPWRDSLTVRGSDVQPGSSCDILPRQRDACAEHRARSASAMSPRLG